MKRSLVFLLAILVGAFFVFLWTLRGGNGPVRGDEGTYIAMAESLAFEGDLRFDRRDRLRLEAEERPGRKPVILQRVGPQVAYSKPILYPLLSAPLYRLAGDWGLVALNVACLALGLFCVARYLARVTGRDPTATVVSFAGLSLFIPYVVWRTSDLLQASLIMAGLALALWDLPRGADSAPRRLAGPPLARLTVGALLLGLVVTLRLTNAPLAAVPVLAWWINRRRLQGLVAAAVIAGTLVAGAGVTYWLSGAPNPYLAVRATFTPGTGYPEDTGLEGPRSPFDVDRASYDATKKIFEAPLASTYNVVYFLIGRHSGVLLYFPLVLFLVVTACRSPDRTTWTVVGMAAGLSAFYLVFIPFNYFGGATCVGNRYFLVTYAVIPFALRRLPSRRSLAAAWAFSLLIASSAAASTVTTADRNQSTQNHAFAGLFRRMPFESTAKEVDGIQDIFWTKELARFLDPYASPAKWKFRLDSESSPAQIQVANRRSDELLRFLVLSSAPRIDFVYRDWGQTTRVPLERPQGRRGLVEIEPSTALRYHPLWFINVWDHGLPYYIRQFSLAVRTPDGLPAEAEIRYLGVHPWPDGAFSRESIAIEIPERAISGSVTSIPLQLRNTSSEVWWNNGVFPVYLSYRLLPEGKPEAASEGPRRLLPRPVPPGGEVETRLAVTWPTQPGRYYLVVDLLIEGVAWFFTEVGSPLGEGLVVVGSPPIPGQRPADSRPAVGSPAHGRG